MRMVLEIPESVNKIHVFCDNLGIANALMLQYSPYMSIVPENMLGQIEVTIRQTGRRVEVDAYSSSKAWEIPNEKRIIYFIKNCIHRIVTEKESTIYLHSACLARNGKAVALVGKTGAGKSTLSTYLMLNGFDYLTDDCTIINTKSMDVLPYRKLIQLRVDTVTVLEKSGMSFPYFPIGEGSHNWAIIPNKLQQPKNKLTTIVILERGDSCGLLEEKRVINRIGVLMENAYSINNIEQKFNRIKELASSMPVYRIKYSSLEEGYKLLTSLLQG